MPGFGRLRRSSVNDPSIRGVAAWPLVPTLLGAVLLGGGIIVGAYWLLARYVLIGSEPLTRAQGLTAAFATATAAGALVALVVNVRKQDLAEQAARQGLTGAFTERFAAAATQLGSTAPAQRLAGVYAMAALADDYPSRAQQCVDVLCGYLRLPFDPESDELAERITETERKDADGSVVTRVTPATRPFDRQVRETVVTVIREHTQNHARSSWSGLSFDLSGAHLTDVNLRGSIFSVHTSFDGATFSGQIASFQGTKFSGESSFDRATFSSSTTLFESAMFGSKLTSFGGATFSSKLTSFRWATFASPLTWFAASTFSGQRTSFNWASFVGTVSFSSEASEWFRNPTGATTLYGPVLYLGCHVTFDGVKQKGRVIIGLKSPELRGGATITADGEPFRGSPDYPCSSEASLSRADSTSPARADG